MPDDTITGLLNKEQEEYIKKTLLTPLGNTVDDNVDDNIEGKKAPNAEPKEPDGNASSLKKPEDQEDTKPSKDDDSGPLTISDKSLVMWTDPDTGEETPVEWSRIKGNTILKARYDEWIAKEKKPLEEKAKQFKDVSEWYARDPLGYLEFHAEQLGIRVVFEDVKTGEQIDMDAYKRSVKPPEVEEATHKTAEAEQKVFEATMRADKIEAMAEVNKDREAKLTSGIVKRADENYREMFEICKKRAPENPYRYALKLAIADEPPVSQKKEMRRREPVEPKSGKEENEEEIRNSSDPDTLKFLIKKGFYRKS